ncbi:MAG: hypothetical protein K2V38_12740 [Gemmataceae bacterium]|nr:hypothetical protein [Gemmataceae bacterium]
MIESPVLTKWFKQCEAATRQTVIIESLENCFGPVPADVSAAVRVINDEDELKELNKKAVTCATLNDFRTALNPPQNPAT